MTQSVSTPPAPGGTAQSDESTTEQAKQKATEVAGQAQEKAQEAAGQATERVREQVNQRSTQAGEQVSTQAADVRTVAEELRKQGKDKPAELADKAADRAEQLGGYLKEADADKLLSDVEQFGRRKPWALALAGLALGAAASRFLKASSTERYRSSQRFEETGNGHSPQGFRPASTRPPVQAGRPFNEQV